MKNLSPNEYLKENSGSIKSENRYKNSKMGVKTFKLVGNINLCNVITLKGVLLGWGKTPDLHNNGT